MQRKERLGYGAKGVGYGAKGGKAGPGNTTIRDLLADEMFTEAVVEFLGSTKVGEVKDGIVRWDVVAV